MTSEEKTADESRDEAVRPPSSFLTRLPDVENVYELVVVAAQRARQLNLASRILPPENGVKPVEKALGEALAKTVKYEVQEKAAQKEES
jgi:DNA-directed RNA polymerase omega subunit